MLYLIYRELETSSGDEYRIYGAGDSLEKAALDAKENILNSWPVDLIGIEIPYPENKRGPTKIEFTSRVHMPKELLGCPATANLMHQIGFSYAFKIHRFRFVNGIADVLAGTESS